jgi:hypothetical protein
MNTELRRSPRYADFLPISLSACRNDNGKHVAGPLSARILDLSNHGSCLLLTQVMIQSFHIFHSTREDDFIDLILHIELPGQKDTLEIPTKPIWLNATKLDDIKVFKMGVNFLERIDENLLQNINKMINQK